MPKNGTRTIRPARARSQVTMISRRSIRSASRPPTGAANVPAELTAELGIAVAPLELRFGDRAFSDGVDMFGADFYRLLRTEAQPASTAAPAPGRYLEAYRSIGAEEVLCVTLGSGLSV